MVMCAELSKSELAFTLFEVAESVGSQERGELQVLVLTNDFMTYYSTHFQAVTGTRS